MHSEFARIVAFASAMQDRLTQRTVSSRFGTALFHDALPLVWYLNVLRVERAGALGADELAAEADVLQDEFDHRKVEINDERGAALEDGFRALGWKVERDVAMVFRGPAIRTGDTERAIEVSAADLRSTWEQGIRESLPGAGEEEVRQLITAQLLRETAVEVRYFAVRENGRPVSECSLFSDSRIAQVESVRTLDAYRGRGHASAVVLRAVREAVAANHELVFLYADDDDWPKELYAKLGFEPAGRVWEFVREPKPRTDPTSRPPQSPAEGG